MNNQVREKADQVAGLPNSCWFAPFTDAATAEICGYRRRVAGLSGRSRTLYLDSKLACALPLCAENAYSSVIFDGALFNQAELRAELGTLLIPANNDAELILAGYLRWGQDFLSRLRGMFALVIWDSLHEILLCVRDPLGSHPLFYADGRDGLLVSPSVDVLLEHPHVSRALNRPALVDHFLDRYPLLEETCFEAVNRVPPGHVLRLASDGRRAFRYWDPAPNGEVD